MEMNTLTPADVRKLPDGKHADGKYLYLVVKGDSRSWVVRGPRDAAGKRLERGLGSTDLVSLAIARRKRDELLTAWQEGRDPLEERRQAIAAAAKRKTFAQAAATVIETRRASWKVSELKGKSSTLEQWTKDMAVDCKPIANKSVDLIDRDDIKTIVLPLIKRGHLPRAKALVGRIELVIEYALKEGWRTADNPAAWRRVDHLFPPAPQGMRPHHASLPWTEVPAFVERLRGAGGVSARILEFSILTATRSQEARGARWTEIDFDRRVWTVPATRMKKAIKHEVPLSEQAVALLRRMETERAGDFVFPGGHGEARDAQKPMRNQSVWNLVQRLTDGATVHGFRSSFTIWAKNNGVDRQLADRCLAHEDGDKTDQAYGGIGRDQLTEPRRPIMEAWARFVDGETSDNVVPFRKVG